MTQLLLHLWGDYILQSDWMAQNKTKDSLAALAHCLTYSAGFVLLRPTFAAWLIIFGTHFLIDRFRLARYVVWATNWLGPIQEMKLAHPQTGVETHFVNTCRTPPWEYCKATGCPPSVPAWMAVWLMIIADNTLHLTINYLSLRYL